MMGISGGFTPPSNISGPGGQSGDNASFPILNSPEMQSILGGLDIQAQQVTHVKKQDGLHLDNSHMPEVHLMDMNADQQQAIQQLLGETVGLQAALLVASEDEIKLLKKRIGEIQDTMIDQEKLEKMLSMLGLSATGQTFALRDQQGGIVIIQQAIDELESSLDDEDEEEGD